MPKLVSTNPAKNYELVGEVSVSTASEIAENVKKAQATKEAWKELGVKKRVELMKPIVEEFEGRQGEVAQIITKEVGKPIRQSRDEVRGYIGDFKWFIENVESSLAEQVTFEDEKSLHKMVHEPSGVAAVITPWNFPFGMAVWGIVPNLLVGNTVVFKTSEECPLLGKVVEEIFLNHDLPDGVFAEVYGNGNVGEQLAKSDINLIWFTGSSKTGGFLYKIAADKFVKVILEMGGSNPGIVFEDVDIEKAANIMADARLLNCGQDCSAVKRLLVEESIYKEFIPHLKKTFKSKVIGSPDDEKTDVGSLVAKRQLELLEGQVNDSLDKGAKIVYQAKLPKNLKGAFYPLTILNNIDKDMRVWREEVFGPVLSVVPFKTEEEAVEFANDTIYGLGSRIISNDKEKIDRVASKIEAGTVEVNKGDRWLLCNPYGGYKNSGMGIEHGTRGFQELCRVKIIAYSK
ncbi:MAG: aldehyde dehydrogenase family protein [Candidatus Woykebacteria bacterium]